MATGTAGDIGRHYHTAQVHYLIAAITYADGNAKVYTLGTLPPSAIVIRGGVSVTTVFNFGTNNLIDIGVTADDDDFATNLSLATVGNIVADEMATATDFYSTSARTVTATLDLTGTAGTTGAGFVWVEYLVTDIG